MYPSSLGLTGCAISRGGFYRWDNKTDDAPFANGAMVVIPRSKDGAAVQIAGCSSGSYIGTVAFRVYSASGDSEWGYINPPMVPGVEYRTTEMYNNKAVYTKVIQFGKMPNSRKAGVGHGASVSQIVRHTAMNVTTGSTLGCSFEHDPEKPVAYCTVDKTTVYIEAVVDCSKYDAEVQIWYTKD